VDYKQSGGVGDGGCFDFATDFEMKAADMVSPPPSARGRKLAPDAPKEVKGPVAGWVKWMTSMRAPLSL
jgi:hypothetical protein